MAETAHNIHVYKEEWMTRLQDRLSEPTKFKEICNVEYTNTQVLHNPYLTDPTVQTGSRGSTYAMQNITETDESVTINTFKILSQFIDRADLAQSTFLSQMEAADRQGVLLNESIETAVYANFANLTAFDNSAIGGASGSIVPSAVNVDDIIRAVLRKIRVAGGESLLNRNGGFIVWTPANFEYLEAFMQANGFVSADTALGGRAKPSTSGREYMGLTHYTSNLLNANHMIGGVKGVYHLGILRATYGQIMVDDKDPNLTSGISIVSRVDFKEKVWNKTKPVLFDIQI